MVKSGEAPNRPIPEAGVGKDGNPGADGAPGRMTMSFAPEPCFELLPHVGEVRLQARGPTIADVFSQAAAALAEVLVSGPAPHGEEQAHEIVLGAPDRDALLVDWLNELLFLAERHRWLPARIEVHEATETHLRATVRGPVLECAPSLVKAATWHGLRFDARNGGFEAEVLLDI